MKESATAADITCMTAPRTCRACGAPLHGDVRWCLHCYEPARELTPRAAVWAQGEFVDNPIHTGGPVPHWSRWEKTATTFGPWGRIGLSVCYDLRFPQLYRRLAKQGAFALTVPSAFTETTGKAHWHVLLRARAIENGAFMIAPAQGGLHANGRRTYGHSLIVGPWGEVLAEGGTEPGIFAAEIDPQLSVEARAKVPSLEHDREFIIP